MLKFNFKPVKDGLGQARMSAYPLSSYCREVGFNKLVKIKQQRERIQYINQYSDLD